MQEYDYSTRSTPQSEPIPGSSQVPNSAGGYAFAVTDWDRLDRFLVLGTEGGTYYATERKISIENAKCIHRCIEENGVRTVSHILNMERRVPKNDPSLFALAMCSALGNLDTRKAAFLALPLIARTGTHLFQFCAYREQFGGWGRSMREAIRRWYNHKSPDQVAYQALKYQQREGWSHRDILRLAHPKSEDKNELYSYMVGKPRWSRQRPKLIEGYQAVQAAESKDIPRLIMEYSLTREMLPTEALNSPAVWEALLDQMPMTAMIRNLGKMTTVGLLKPMSGPTGFVCDRLIDEERLYKARIHPIAILAALATYEQGHGQRGKLSWDPNRQIIDALNESFYKCFQNVEPTGKRILLALDISGSMSWGQIAGVPGITPRVASAAMAMVTARTEPTWECMVFTSTPQPFTISPTQRLDDIVRRTAHLRMGGTDCALPMIYAQAHKVEVDAFVIYTDNETWAGSIHPVQALQAYRRDFGIPSKLIVVGMTATEFSIADPQDAGMLDVVGFDSAAPNIMSDFIR